MQLDQTGLLILAGLIVAVLGFIAFLRYLRMRERVALIEKGLWPPKTEAGSGAERDAAPENGKLERQPHRALDREVLRNGFVTAAIGAAIVLGFLVIGQPGIWLLVGLVPLFLGLAMVTAERLDGWKDENPLRNGLMTAAVGLALTVGIYLAWGENLALLLGLLPLLIGAGMCLAEWPARRAA